MIRGMYSKLPQSVYLKNEKYSINTDYRIFIEFEEDMRDKGDNKVIVNALKSFYPAFFQIKDKEILMEAIDKFLWFYRCGKNEDELPKKKGNKSNTRIYSYKYDELYIWGEFKRNYGVNLSVDKIHWWEFKAMWMALPSECEFNKIKGYRSYKGNDKDILELKEYYKLPLTQMEIEDKLRRDKLYEMLK